MMISREIPTFHKEIWNFRAIAEIFLRILQLLAFSGPARPGCARPCKTNAIPSLFRGSERLRANFSKKSLFHRITVKIQQNEFLADFIFFSGIHDFH